MEVLRALSTMSVEALFHDHVFGHPTMLDDNFSSSSSDASVGPWSAPLSTETREEKLFELFTAYAMQISPEDPTTIRLVNVIKLLHDCGVVQDTVATSSAAARDRGPLQSVPGTAGEPLTIRDVEIVASKLMHTSTTGSKLAYEPFLKLLWDLALHANPGTPPAVAFKLLVDQCVRNQPRTKARVRTNVDDAYKRADKVFAFFEPSLVEIFKFYANATHTTSCKTRNRLKATAPPLSKPPSMPPPSKKKSPPANILLYLNYHDTFAFARKFGLVTHGGVTVAEFAASYMESVEKVKNTTRQLTYLGFCHLLVRLALRLFGDAPVPTPVQLKALFQFMWLNSLDTSAAETTKLCGHRDHNATMLHGEGTTLFRTLFLKQWKKDNFVDYAAQVQSRPAAVARNTAIKKVLADVWPVHFTRPKALLEPMAFTWSP
ncbi:Aste57867_112 [Aphanomyces stellatus]|uniref:Aste57867_112 protein n=1 Tax=Aphanomyces stellatus TaxID=120398 RepID=A0A485K2W7_9STRA|nr:hypothetical protein As57867_000112 [Aphanomyces stellatus]VFT77338.1 Aste57867_112 [Aphanomyces stellatus]